MNTSKDMNHTHGEDKEGGGATQVLQVAWGNKTDRASRGGAEKGVKCQGSWQAVLEATEVQVEGEGMAGE
jgi:hypothetical protein